MYQKVDHPEKPCIECGGLFKPKTKTTAYCSQKCRLRRKDRERAKDPAYNEGRRKRYAIDPTRGYTATCQGCNKEYKPKRSKTKYCSRACAFKNHNDWLVAGGAWGEHCEMPRYTLVRQKECTECGLIHYSKDTTLAMCSESCKILRTDRLRKEGLQRVTHSCPTCGILYCRINGERFRDCPECAIEKYKQQRKKAKARQNRVRRARKYGVKYEAFDPIDVLRRDNWQCQACDCETPERLRGTQHEDAPESDHVIPLSEGGEHTMANSQCLCRTCNNMKGTMSMNKYMISIGKKATF